MVSKLLNNIYTVTDRAVVITDLDKVYEQLFKAHTNVGNDIKQDLSIDFGPTILAFIQDEKDKVSAVAKLKEMIRSMKELTMTLAFRPKYAEISRIGQAVKRMWGENVVLKLSYDPDLIGGARITIDGKYFDKSVLTGVNNYLAYHEIAV